METVLITGAARRLGSLTAEKLAAEGCFVWIHYRTHEQEAFELRDRIRYSGGQADCIRADLADIGEIDSMLDRLAGSANGQLTTLINNASIFPRGTLKSQTPEEWDQVMNVNLKAVWYLSKGFSVRFADAKRIISIGDASVAAGFRDHAAYGLSKFGLKYLTQQMAAAFAPGIRVNLLSPGYVLPGDNEPESIWQTRTGRTLTDNGNIADAVVRGVEFLMSDPGMTGTELIIDNGLQIFCKNGILK